MTKLLGLATARLPMRCQSESGGLLQTSRMTRCSSRERVSDCGVGERLIAAALSEPIVASNNCCLESVKQERTREAAIHPPPLIRETSEIQQLYRSPFKLSRLTSS
jgi:hypothetical protein